MATPRATPSAKPALAEGFFIGLMSGTSLDGVDGVLCRFGAAPRQSVAVLTSAHAPMPAELYTEFLALQSAGANELHRAALAGNALARLQAQVVEALLKQAGLAPDAIAAVGSHGQTVRHQPGLHDGLGYTCQINNPALLAELTGIAVVADFRSRDVAAGGQGAPLVPAFHAAVFGQPTQAVAVLNLGGIANLTLLPAQSSGLAPRGFDCGPANVLLDGWARRHLGQPFDAGGAWGAGGRVIAPLMERLLQEPFLALPAPKSTGRDLFNEAWLAQQLAPFAQASPQDVQASLLDYTAACVQGALAREWSSESAGSHPRWPLWVCGGGAKNSALMQRLAERLEGQFDVASTEAAGLAPHDVEAAAFAWLARAHLLGEPGQMPEVTGAKGRRVLGALYPA